MRRAVDAAQKAGIIAAMEYLEKKQTKRYLFSQFMATVSLHDMKEAKIFRMLKTIYVEVD